MIEQRQGITRSPIVENILEILGYGGENLDPDLKLKQEEFRAFLEKAGGSVIQLLTLPVELCDKPYFTTADVIRAFTALKSGNIAILYEKCPRTMRGEKPFLVFPTMKDGQRYPMPDLLLFNAAINPESYEITTSSGFPMIRYK